MDAPARFKLKNKKSKPKSAKKPKSDGPSCSMFLGELKRFALRKKQEDTDKNVVETIIESISNALPIKFSRSPQQKDSPVKLETLQTYAPELLPNDTINIPHPVNLNELPPLNIEEIVESTSKTGFKMPKMPLVSSDVLKRPEKKLKVVKEDIAVNTGGDHDVASEITKHVATLRKISLIAEEFNQKTARNLKEIVDSVEHDLIKKLEEVQAQENASSNKSDHEKNDV